MGLFGFSIVRTERLNDLKLFEAKYQAVVQCHRWFAGWKDLDIIWDYILSADYFGSISSCRREYARARGTDEYGNPTEPSK